MDTIVDGELVPIDMLMAVNNDRRMDAVFHTDDEVVDDNDFIGISILVIREEVSNG